MWKEQIEGSQDAVGPRDHISYHLDVPEFELLQKYAETTQIPFQKRLLLSPEFTKRVFAPDEEHTNYRIKFLNNTLEEGQGVIFESAAHAAGIELQKKSLRSHLKK